MDDTVIETEGFDEWLDEDYEDQAEEAALAALEDRIERDEEEYMSINW